MTKTWETKKKIVKLIKKKPKTAMEISKELDLAPSTVSEHIEALEKIGAIKKKENPYIKKWKYYEAKQDFDLNTAAKSRFVTLMPKIAATLIIAVAILAVVVLGLPPFASANQLTYSLTDPPQVPNGTQALTIDYASLQAHIAGNSNTSGWISGSGSGTLNLMTLINTSQVIGTGAIPANATIDMIRFSIKSATITINGTTYNVTVPNGELTAPVTGNSKINGTSSVLIDLSPVVETIYTENSTDFIMVPSVRAIFIGNSKTPIRIGYREALKTDTAEKLQRAASNISITADSLSIAGNSTTLSVTVKNNGNRSVDIRHIILSGKPTVFASANQIGAQSDDEGPQMGGEMPMMRTGVGARMIEDMGRLDMVKMRILMFRTLNFIVEQNGTLALPSVHNMDLDFSGSGYALGAGQSATFTFSGQVLFGNSHIRIAPESNTTYEIAVMGEMGAFAKTSVKVS